MKIETGYTELSEATIAYLKDNFELFEMIDDPEGDQRDGAEFAFAEIDGQIVGALQYVGNTLYLLQSKPGTGAGKALIDALKAENDELHLHAAIPGAQKYYESMGFEKIGRADWVGNQDMVWYAD